MIDTALQQPSLAQEARNVTFALRALLLATRRLASALWAALTKRSEPCQLRSARQEADKLRAYADRLYLSDPRYAQDLYAAATRHEHSAAEQ